MSDVTIYFPSHASDGRKSTPLHLAAGYNRTRIVEILLQHGADVHAKDKGGLVPLHNACSYGHYEVSQVVQARNMEEALIRPYIKFILSDFSRVHSISRSVVGWSICPSVGHKVRERYFEAN